MEVLVYGAGAVGGYLGAKLALAGHQVMLVTRPETANLINHQGLLLTQSGLTSQPPVRAAGNLNDALRDRQYDLIILSMKSYDLEPAVSCLADLCPRPNQIMNFQNGIGVEEIITNRFDPYRVIAGVITIPIRRPSPNRIEVGREGRGLGLAPVRYGRPIQQWVDMFVEAGIHAGGVADYRAMKWSKAFLNIMGNASSAILNSSPVDIYQDPSLFDMEMRMCRETLAVMKKLGLPIVNLPRASIRPLAYLVNYGPDFLLRLVFTQVIIHGRGEKMPSFHIDLVAGKGRSEVVFHNGAIAAAGRDVGVATPVNAMFNDLLMRLTNGQADRSDYDHNPKRLLAELAVYDA